MLTLISAKFATVEELFRYKKNHFKLKRFPGYTYDQWGIKAHNRPWIEEVGEFSKNQRVIEVGGAYSTLPEFLANKYSLNAWIGDDFGVESGEKIWSRWGNPKLYSKSNPHTKYIYKQFGKFSSKYPTHYFDRIFSVSTLEHIPMDYRISVFKDMNRCTRRGGMQLHTIDISTITINKAMLNIITDRIPNLYNTHPYGVSELKAWEEILIRSGIKIATKMPSIASLFDRATLVESPDVSYRFIPPVNAPKPYKFPAASLLLIIKDL